MIPLLMGILCSAAHAQPPIAINGYPSQLAFDAEGALWTNTGWGSSNLQRWDLDTHTAQPVAKSHPSPQLIFATRNGTILGVTHTTLVNITADPSAPIAQHDTLTGPQMMSQGPAGHRAVLGKSVPPREPKPTREEQTTWSRTGRLVRYTPDGVSTDLNVPNCARTYGLGIDVRERVWLSCTAGLQLASGDNVGPPKWPGFAAVNPTGDRVAIGDGERMVLLDAHTDRVLWEGAQAGHPRLWSADGTQLALVAAKAVHLVGVDGDQVKEHRRTTIPARQLGVLAWSVDGSRLAVGAGQSIHLIDGITGALMTDAAGHDVPISAAAVSKRGDVAITGDPFGDRYLWRRDGTVQPIGEAPNDPTDIGNQRSNVDITLQATLSHNAAIAATGHGSGVVQILDTQTGLVKQVLQADLTTTPIADERIIAFETTDGRRPNDGSCGELGARTMYPLVLSSDGSRVAIPGYDMRRNADHALVATHRFVIRVWHTETGKLEATYVFNHRASPVQFDDNGNLIVHAGATLVSIGDDTTFLAEGDVAWATTDDDGTLIWAGPFDYKDPKTKPPVQYNTESGFDGFGRYGVRIEDNRVVF